MTNEELAALRVMLREEVSAAVYASETRLGEKIDRRIDQVDHRIDELENKVEQRFDALEERMGVLEERIGGLEQRVTRLEGMVQSMTEHLILLRAGVRQAQSDIATLQADMVQVVSILDGITVRINELQDGQHDLEASLRLFQAKVEDQLASVRRDIQKLNAAVQGLSARLDRHESLPVQQAHPNSAA